jgi:valyl-tRNA synthetase
MHERSVPWHNIAISGWILDPDRKKMSKSKGNVVTPMELLDTYTADAVRYWAARARAGVDTAYDEAVYKVGKRLTTKLTNAARFVAGCLSRPGAEGLSPSPVVQLELDRALISRLRKIVSDATEAYEGYDWATPLASIESFFWAEYCDDYLEIIKARAYREALDEARVSALSTLRLSLSVLIRLFAPTLPFVCEDLWQRHFGHEDKSFRSVHKAPWPSAAELATIPEPVDASSYSTMRTVLEEVRRLKGARKLTLRHPLELLKVTVPSAPTDALRAALDDVRDATVAQELIIDHGPALSVEARLAPVPE